jgi:hypothetical protein
MVIIIIMCTHGDSTNPDFVVLLCELAAAVTLTTNNDHRGCYRPSQDPLNPQPRIASWLMLMLC